jgi:hypothetical protein
MIYNNRYKYKPRKQSEIVNLLHIRGKNGEMIFETNNNEMVIAWDIRVPPLKAQS